MSCSLKEHVSFERKEEVMNLTQIGEALREERGIFRQAIQDAVDQSTARRNKLWSELSEGLKFESPEKISEDDFTAFLELLGETSKNLSEILHQAGFSNESIADWLGKKSMPPEVFWKPLLHVLITTVYDDAGPLSELGHILEELGIDPRPSSTKLPLEKKIEDLGFSRGFSTRLFNCINNAYVVSLGELLVTTQAEWLREPNFGHKTLKELDNALKEHFGVGVGQIPESERERYAGLVKARKELTQTKGELLLSHWKGEIKPEYEGLGWQTLQEKRRAGTELYTQVNADPELLEAVKRSGIAYKTQLATAPKSVIDQICDGHPDWIMQLLKILNGEHEWGMTLELQTKVPPHLDEKVVVYGQ